jgi:predicted nucleotidyltransferase component of viral defense system
MPIGAARERFAQYGVLLGVGRSKLLSERLAFKGGNALDFVWCVNRSTRDLDFSLSGDEPGVAELCRQLEAGMRAAEVATGIRYRLQSLKPAEPRGRTRITYVVKFGFALPDDTANARRISRGEDVSTVIPIEVSINEVICDTEPLEVGEESTLRVCSPNDIAAEKLRAMLQQVTRNRHRPQDVLDLAVMLNSGIHLDPQSVLQYALLKSESRGVTVTRKAFEDPEVWRRAKSGYDDLEHFTRRLFIPFEEARDVLTRFLNTLPWSERD